MRNHCLAYPKSKFCFNSRLPKIDGDWHEFESKQRKKQGKLKCEIPPPAPPLQERLPSGTTTAITPKDRRISSNSHADIPLASMPNKSHQPVNYLPPPTASKYDDEDSRNKYSQKSPTRKDDSGQSKDRRNAKREARDEKRDRSKDRNQSSSYNRGVSYADSGLMDKVSYRKREESASHGDDARRLGSHGKERSETLEKNKESNLKSSSKDIEQTTQYHRRGRSKNDDDYRKVDRMPRDEPELVHERRRESQRGDYQGSRDESRRKSQDSARRDDSHYKTQQDRRNRNSYTNNDWSDDSRAYRHSANHLNESFLYTRNEYPYERSHYDDRPYQYNRSVDFRSRNMSAYRDYQDHRDYHPQHAEDNRAYRNATPRKGAALAPQIQLTGTFLGLIDFRDLLSGMIQETMCIEPIETLNRRKVMIVIKRDLIAMMSKDLGMTIGRVETITRLAKRGKERMKGIKVQGERDPVRLLASIKGIRVQSESGPLHLRKNL